MRCLLIYVSITFFITVKASSDITKKIIMNLENTNNYNFNFIQKIDQNKETGNCILVFNRKINCKYDNSGKIIVSDGKYLVIKNINSKIPNFYKLENTSFYKLLDKEYLIDELGSRDIKNEYGKLIINLNYQNIEIKVFFDKDNLHLKGWKTTDIYNNSVLTEIIITEVNKIIDHNLFDLKKFN